MRCRAASFIILLTVFLACVFFSSCDGIDVLLEDKMYFASDGNGGAVLVSVQGYRGKDAVIPSVSPEGKPVVGIGSEAFSGSGVLSVTVPDGVTFIDSRAFAGCRSISRFHIPDTVTELGTRVFEGCSSLMEITVGEGNAVYFSSGNCVIIRENGVLAAGCGGSVIPDGVTAIASGAFYGSSRLEALSIPEGVTAVDSYAFYGCSAIKTVSLPESIRYIGAYAFNGCSALSEITVSQGVTVLNEGVFRNCASLVTVNLPVGLTAVGDMAFQGCSSLVDPVLPEGLESIGGLAFSGCNSFIHLKLPKSLHHVGDGAFSYCDMLWGIKVDKENPVFRAESNCLIRRSDGVIILGTRGSTIPADESVTAIAERAFFGAKHLKDAVIPQNIRSVGKEAFYGCDYLEWVRIEGAERIGDGAFAHCFTLREAVISDTVAVMGSGVFAGCTALEELRIGAESIPDGWKNDWNGSEAEPMPNV